MDPVVTTRKGRVAGIERNGVCVFRSLPYAQPPVGALRWRAPQPLDAWSGVRDATGAPPAPPQPRSPMDAVTSERGELAASEDCLYLSLWTPGCDSARRPVLVWIHGGGLLFGWAGDASYDGRNLARRADVVVVSVGYRLGSLGVLAHPALADESGALGNYGLLDQVAALEWIRDEIEAFGGDPARVTIFGESAGGMSVGALCGTPRARGLFQAAIAQSGGALASPLERAVAFAEKLADELGISRGEIQRLREVPAPKLVEAQQKAGIFGLTIRGGGFTVDGQVLPEPPLEMIRRGCSNGVTLLSGTNRDEARLGLGLRRRRIPEIAEADLVPRVARWLDGDEARARHAIEVFRKARTERGESTSPIDLLLAIETELRYRRLSLELLDAHLAETPCAYSYLFTFESKALGGVMGSAHGLDIPFVFGNFGAQRFTGPIGAPERELSERMQDAWISLARTGDPSHPGVGTWPRYEETQRATMELGLQSGVLEAPYETERGVWAQEES